MPEPKTPEEEAAPLLDLLTDTQKTLLRAVRGGTLDGVRVTYSPIIRGFIGEVTLLLTEPDADTVVRRIYSVTPTGTIWDDHVVRMEDLR